ncbi:hypothetical protein Leryth_018655 [Lithospermum erythrorhizon]|nr:hypothetical protein Leryth_018655 [Lithospermum erythrorhizon]
MNHHVNNVKYVKWMVETIPDQFLENHQLSSIILEYRRECGSADLVQSLCEPNKGVQEIEYQPGTNLSSPLNGFSLVPGAPKSHGSLELLHPGPVSHTHLLKIKGQTKNEEIVRGKTSWKRKIGSIPFST